MELPTSPRYYSFCGITYSMQRPTINNLDYKSMGQDDQCVGPRDEDEMDNLHVVDFLDAH